MALCVNHYMMDKRLPSDGLNILKITKLWNVMFLLMFIKKKTIERVK